FRVRQRDDHLSVAIDYRDDDGLLLRTAIGMRSAPLTAARAWRVLARQPLNAINVVLRIHWHALRLWLARVPFYGKAPPGRSSAPDPSLSRLPGASSSERAAMSDHEARP
ncbi:DUF1365 family protein, partial [Burkholderia anthina]|uniref:DUF1365 family protein n=2 Tax=Burkholderiaceae TaxID=119060 RepID=UPI00158E462E